MFFYEKLKSILPTDRVLEVGPGGNPHPRSDVLLDKVFDEVEAAEQRGHAPVLDTGKEVFYYEGDIFPFEDGQFDYVICTHVLEHVPADKIEIFLGELQRVATKGYIEYPTIYYEYLYNFKVHKTALNIKNSLIYYADKNDLGLNNFYPLQVFFYNTLVAGMDELVVNNKSMFFQGFEWFGGGLKACRTRNVEDFVLAQEGRYEVQHVARRGLVGRIMKRIFR